MTVRSVSFSSGITGFCAVVLLASLVAGCAASGESTGTQNFRTNLGTTSPEALISETSDALLGRYSYRYQRRVTSPEDIRLETEWREDTALPDEQELGFSRVRTRITVTARPRNRTEGTVASTFVAEVEGQQGSSINWEPVPLTEDREEYFREISNFISRQVRTVR